MEPSVPGIGISREARDFGFLHEQTIDLLDQAKQIFTTEDLLVSHLDEAERDVWMEEWRTAQREYLACYALLRSGQTLQALELARQVLSKTEALQIRALSAGLAVNEKSAARYIATAESQKGAIDEAFASRGTMYSGTAEWLKSYSNGDVYNRYLCALSNLGLAKELFHEGHYDQSAVWALSAVESFAYVLRMI